MTQQQIEGTRLIAEYMGYNYYPASLEYPESDYFRLQENEEGHIDRIHPEDMPPYSTSLDAISPVVKKVYEDMYNAEPLHVMQIGFQMAIGGSMLDIGTIFQIVVSAIKFLNDKKK